MAVQYTLIIPRFRIRRVLPERIYRDFQGLPINHLPTLMSASSCINLPRCFFVYLLQSTPFETQQRNSEDEC